MVRTFTTAALALLMSAGVSAATFKVFGSAGAESQLTPANTASPLLHGNTGAVTYRTDSADANLFMEVAPESRAWKLHVKVRGDGSDRASESLSAGEAFLQMSPRPWLDVTVGRVIEKWGSGYAWNPTGFVSPRKNPADPGDRRSAYRGVDMIRADVFVHDTNISLYALEHGAIAARVYRLVAGTDISLLFRRDGDGTQQGISVSRVFGDALELHAEAARRHALAGGQYTFHNNVNVVAELYHGGEGLSEADWRDFQGRIDLARDAASIIAVNREYKPLLMARNYSFVRVYCPTWIETELLAITNLRDRSTLVRLTLSRKLRSNVSAYLIDTEFSGARGSELSYMQVRRSTVAGLRIYF